MSLSRFVAPLLLVCACVVGEDAEDSHDDNLGTSFAAPLTWPRVDEGDLNQDVTTVQYLLVEAGFATSGLDGKFGPATTSAVVSFQQLHDLAADGIVGDQTWRALIVEVGAADTGPAVSAVQYLLKQRYAASLDVTGTFGPTTLDRVKAFQASRCLAATGVVGLYTWNALVARRSWCVGASGAAQRVLVAHNAGILTLWDQNFGRFDGADPLSNIRDAAAGRAARTGCDGNAPCKTVMLSAKLLSAMIALREQHGLRYFATSIAGGNHSASSYHYSGRAIDVDEVNGVRIIGDSASARQLMAACRALGAIEVLGPNNDPNHHDHVHCAW